MKKKIVKTRDGSNTIFVPEFEETYHSTHGAIQESLHVFIHSGLNFKTEKRLGSITLYLSINEDLYHSFKRKCKLLANNPIL